MNDVNDRRTAVGPKVLCIDDNSELLGVEKALLERVGYQVVLASDGVEGLALAKDSDVSLVVLDLEMPRMNGIEVAKRLRALRPLLPIIMVSGIDFSNEPAPFVDCFVPKTQMATTLAREVNRFLRKPAGGV